MLDPVDPKSRQFSLRELLAATTVLCGSLAIARAPVALWCALFTAAVAIVCVAAWRRPRGMILAAAVGMGLGMLIGVFVLMGWLQSSAVPNVAGGRPFGDPDAFRDGVLQAVQLCLTACAAVGAIVGVMVCRRWGGRDLHAAAPGMTDWDWQEGGAGTNSGGDSPASQ